MFSVFSDCLVQSNIPVLQLADTVVLILPMQAMKLNLHWWGEPGSPLFSCQHCRLHGPKPCAGAKKCQGLLDQGGTAGAKPPHRRSEIGMPPFVAVTLRVRVCICNGFAKPLSPPPPPVLSIKSNRLNTENVLTGVLLACVYQPGSGVGCNLWEEESCHLQRLWGIVWPGHIPQLPLDSCWRVCLGQNAFGKRLPPWGLVSKQSETKKDTGTLKCDAALPNPFEWHPQPPECL